MTPGHTTVVTCAIRNPEVVVVGVTKTAPVTLIVATVITTEEDTAATATTTEDMVVAASSTAVAALTTEGTRQVRTAANRLSIDLGSLLKPISCFVVGLNICLMCFIPVGIR